MIFCVRSPKTTPCNVYFLSLTVIATLLNVRFGDSHGKDTYRDILRRSRSQSLYTSNIVAFSQPGLKAKLSIIFVVCSNKL